MKKGEEDKAQKEKEDNISYQLTKNKYGKYSDLKETICRELDEAEGEILRSQKENNQKAAE